MKDRSMNKVLLAASLVILTPITALADAVSDF